MKKVRAGEYPLLLRGGPLDGRVIRFHELLPEVRIPIQPDFTASLMEAPAIDDRAKLDIRVAVYEKTDSRTTLQLPPPAPKDARRIGYNYHFKRMEKI